MLQPCNPKIATSFLQSYHHINRIFHTVLYLFKVLTVSTNDILWAAHLQGDWKYFVLLRERAMEDKGQKKYYFSVCAISGFYFGWMRMKFSL